MGSRRSAIRSGRAGMLLAVSIAVCGRAGAGLFPDLQPRLPVGDPQAKNPVGNTEGPKTLAAADMDGDGRTDIVVGNLDGSLSVLLSLGGGYFRPQVVTTVPGSIRSVAIADLDRDGKQDVAAADIAGNVWILPGKGNGAFGSPTKIFLADARAIAVGDVNRDGYPDLLVGTGMPDCDRSHGPRGSFLAILLGKGDGAFGEPLFLIQGEAGCIYDVALADLDGDGKLDALALDFGHRAVLLLAGEGDGTFRPLPGLATSGRGPRSFCVAWLDEMLPGGTPPPGATLDLVVADRDSGTLDVFLGRGNFAFDRTYPVSGGDSPRSVVAGDMNGDGLLDLVVSNRNTHTVSVFRGMGGGRFTPSFEAGAGTSPRDLVLADFTGDGALDAAVANRISGDISVLQGRRGLAGFLVPDRFYPAGITPVGLAVADFDRDGIPDAATANLRSHDVRTRPGTGTGDLGEETIYPVDYGPTSLAAGDVDGDGVEDLVVACAGLAGVPGSGAKGSLVTLRGRGDGSFARASIATTGTTSSRPIWLRLADLSGDGELDAAVGGMLGDLYLLRGRGDGTFDAPISKGPPSTGRALTLSVGDLDGDGRPDIVTSRGVIVFGEDRLFQAGRERPWGTFEVGRGDWVVETADLDRDGSLDLIVALTFVEPDPIAVHFGKGDGTFFEPTIYDAGMGVVGLQAADMDGDGTLDIVAANRCTADVTILKGLGGRRFEFLETTRAYSAEGLAVADLNRDGRPDIVGAGVGVWTILNGGESRLSDPKASDAVGVIPAEGIFINEVMPLNREFYTDPGGTETPDWIEVYNHSPISRDLSGWQLANLGRDGKGHGWTFPVGTSIGPDAHLVVFCGGKIVQGLQASFGLNADGETLRLVDAAGKARDEVDFPAVPADVSFARAGDGARFLSYNPVPTMGAPNVRPGNLSPKVTPRNPARSRAGEVILTATTFDDIGLAYATLDVRRPGDAVFQEVMLADDGAHGDGAAGDGVYGAVLPEFPAGTRLLCYFRVVDLEGQASTWPDDPTAEANLLAITVPPLAADLRISEVLADANAGPVAGDWLEITNCGSERASLDGLGLIQDYRAKGAPWPFPAGIRLEPGAQLVVRCDGGAAGDGLHATFRLNKDGDSVLLVSADESRLVYDSITFGDLPPDISFGIPACGEAPVLLARPTPGAPNSAAGVPFRRGDANGDGTLDLTDPIRLLGFLFLGGPALPCAKGGDLDDDGRLDLTDVVGLLGYLFLEGPPPRSPHPDCGIDATPDALECGTAPASCRP